MKLPFSACLLVVLLLTNAYLFGGETSFIPFGLGKNLTELRKKYGEPVVRPAGFFPPSPTFKKGDYFFAFGFRAPQRPSELIFIYRADGSDFSQNEITMILDINKANPNSDWVTCDQIPNQPLNLLKKESYQSTGSDRFWAIHIVSRKSPPAFQPALTILSDTFLMMMNKGANN